MDIQSLPEKSPLISQELEAQLTPLLQKIKTPVTVVSIIGDTPADQEMAIFLKHFVSLSDQLSFKTYAPGTDAALDAALLGGLTPATGFINQSGVCRFSFHGVPGGKEISSFMSALLAAGNAINPLDRPTLKDIAKIQKPTVLEVFVSLACHHCAQLVINAQRIAHENPMVTAHMIDANLYPSLVEKYRIERVPLLVFNGEILSSGALTMAELCEKLKKK